VGFARDQRGWSAFGQFGLRRQPALPGDTAEGPQRPVYAFRPAPGWLSKEPCYPWPTPGRRSSMAEQLFCKQLVGGSIPFAGSNRLDSGSAEVTVIVLAFAAPCDRHG
jgi:hypothetical protein